MPTKSNSTLVCPQNSSATCKMLQQRGFGYAWSKYIRYKYKFNIEAAKTSCKREDAANGHGREPHTANTASAVPHLQSCPAEHPAAAAPLSLKKVTK